MRGIPAASTSSRGLGFIHRGGVLPVDNHSAWWRAGGRVTTESDHAARGERVFVLPRDALCAVLSVAVPCCVCTGGQGY